jgi:hypothetical protein
MGYSPYSPAMTPWTLTLWRGDYTKMMQQLKGLQVNRRLVILVADPECLSRIQGKKYSGPGSGSVIKNFSIFNPVFLSSGKYDDLGCSSPIPDTYLDFFPIPDPGSRGQKAPDTGSGYATLLVIRSSSKEGKSCCCC